jgi:hypothetical protein
VLAALALGVLAAAWSGLVLRVYVGWGQVPGHGLRREISRALGVALAFVAPPVLLYVPWLAGGPGWSRALFVTVWLALFLIFVGLNAEEARDATAGRRHVRSAEISLRVTRRRVAFMLATLCYLALLIGGAVLGLLVLLLIAPARDPEGGAGFSEAIAVALGAFAGMVLSVRVARRLLISVGRVSPAEARLLTRERS